MSDASPAVDGSQSKLESFRTEIAEIRLRARHLFDGGATGVQVAASICEATDRFLVERFVETLGRLPDKQRSAVQCNAALVAVGGTGRGELAPYSDADLLFLYRSTVSQPFFDVVSRVVRDYWDAGLQLGHSVRTTSESISMARQEPEVATALVESRLLWGDELLFEGFRRKFRHRAVAGRRRAFINECIAARDAERTQFGSTVRQLEPDVKRSLGGLRDVHLIRWLGFACHGAADIKSLQLQGALGKDDARRLVAAQEFLMRVRNDLHFHAGKSNDLLTRDEQLRITDEWGTQAVSGQRPVERFMQQYFQHSTAIAEIAQRFVALNRPRSIRGRFTEFLLSHRADGVLKVGPEQIDILAKHRDRLLSDFEQIVKLYHTAVLNRVSPTPKLTEAITAAVPNLDAGVSETSARLFRELLSTSGHLGPTLRSMYRTGVLELLIPDMSHARCLLQFNQYHSYTVDEHSLRAVEAAEHFEEDDGPVGTAYRAIPRKGLLHLALLLHDLGKGFKDDHSHVGEQIAHRMAARLHLTDRHHNMLAFLVKNHLMMVHLAFRRNISEPEVLLEFSRAVGSPEMLRMLYVMTASDLTAVGPGVWTDWKADLLSELYDRTMLILSGKRYQFLEDERLQRVKEHVRASIVPLQSAEGESPPDEVDIERWLQQRLDRFPPHYLTATSPDRIAADLDVIEQLKPGEIAVEGQYDAETGTVEYRVIASENDVAGCFHRTNGTLMAKRLEILSAQICTDLDGIVVDRYFVLDTDYDDEVPQIRIDDVSKAIRDALTGKMPVARMFQKHMRFGATADKRAVSDLPTRVVVDNNSSDRCTIIDVFAHDRPGLLYTISRAIYKMGLSVELAKIATHLDQIVDVFYVTEQNRQKVADGERLKQIQADLTLALAEFDRQGHTAFVG